MKTLAERERKQKLIRNLYMEEIKSKNLKKYRKIKKLITNQKEGFLKNINLHLSKRQDKQGNNNYYYCQNKNITHTDEIMISYISQ